MMNWINFFEHKTKLYHSFGRGINADISKKEEELFNLSYKAFEDLKIVDAYEYFLRSLENFRDETSNQNIVLHRQNDLLHFELYQGNAKIIGTITQEDFYAEVIMVKKENATVALKRYILERNYQLTYARYFSDTLYIKMKIFHKNMTMTPQKIFFPIRELALNADYDKEHIKSEFNSIDLEDISHLKQVNEDELKIKYKYMNQWIEELEHTLLTLPSDDRGSMEAFLYLNILFGIDYLIVPKYTMYQKSSKKLQEYFSDENSSIEAKNEELKRHIGKLKDLNFKQFSENFYEAKYSFNQADNLGYDNVVSFIEDSLVKIRWFKNNRYHQVIPTIYKYIALYSLYNYGLNPIAKSLFHLLVEIQYTEYFSELGYKPYYNIEKESFAKRSIVARIEEIIEPYQERFKSLVPFGDALSYTTMNEFCNSFYLELQTLNFEEI